MAELKYYITYFLLCTMANNNVAEEAPRESVDQDNNKPLQTSGTEEATDIHRPLNSLVDGQCNGNLSKRALKKQKKMEKYLAMKESRKFRRKKLRQERKEKRKITGIPKTPIKVYSMAESKNQHSIVLDLSFENLMNPRDMSKCAHQISRCYAANRRNPNPIRLHICSYANEMKKEISKIDGHEKWDVHFRESDYLSSFERERIVYLTSDSKNVLRTLNENKVYVIGAFVDHNLHKGITLKRATQNKVETARLPLHGNIVLSSGSVLAVNHVFEILLAVSNGVSWHDACMKVIPPRKIAGDIAGGRNAPVISNSDETTGCFESDSRSADALKQTV